MESETREGANSTGDCSRPNISVQYNAKSAFQGVYKSRFCYVRVPICCNYKLTLSDKSTDRYKIHNVQYMYVGVYF